MNEILAEADLLAETNQYWHLDPEMGRVLDAIQDEYGLMNLSLPYSEWNLPRP